MARRWPRWLAFASLFYGAILLMVYAHHNWIADFDKPPLSWQTGYSLTFALFSAAMTFTVLTVSLAFASSNMKLLDAMRPSAYGIFLTHTSLSFGCNTPFTTIPGRPLSSLPSFSPARWR